MKLQEILQKTPEGLLEKTRLWCEACLAYYDTEPDADPLMSDNEFDELQASLLSEATEANCEFVVNLINKSLVKNGEFAFVPNDDEYTQEMISLKKIKWASRATVSEIKKFFADSKVSLDQLKFSPKLDGCSLKIIFGTDDSGNRTIKQILTRGGIDVTNIFNCQRDIQKCIIKYDSHIVCGELLCAKSVFEKKYSDEYENPRNFVGGLVKKKELPLEVINDLTFIPCTDGINTLQATIMLGPVKHHLWNQLTIESLYALEEIVAKFKSDDFDYLCDGIVIGYDEPTHERRVKDNYPLNMAAVKFPAPRARTRVVGFDWTQKKSGKLTPRLMLEPVKLDGSTVTAANGYNIQQVINNGIGIGAEVEIEKSGDIIPVVVKVLKRSANIQYPDVEYVRSGKHLVAVDKEKSRKFKFIAGLRLLQIQGIGDTLAEEIGKAVDYDIIELFNKDRKPDIAAKLGGGANWVHFQEIYNIKALHLDEMINILQFDNVGPKISKKVANLLLKISKDTSNIPSDVFTNVLRGEGFRKINDTIGRLKQLGIAVIRPVEINEDTITYEMSGNPPGMTKGDFEKLMKTKYPNSVHTSLTKETSMLIVDNIASSTSKALKARKYNIKIVSYADIIGK